MQSQNTIGAIQAHISIGMRYIAIPAKGIGPEAHKGVFLSLTPPIRFKMTYGAPRSIAIRRPPTGYKNMGQDAAPNNAFKAMKTVNAPETATLKIAISNKSKI